MHGNNTSLAVSYGLGSLVKLRPLSDSRAIGAVRLAQNQD